MAMHAIYRESMMSQVRRLYSLAATPAHDSTGSGYGLRRGCCSSRRLSHALRRRLERQQGGCGRPVRLVRFLPRSAAVILHSDDTFERDSFCASDNESLVYATSSQGGDL